MKAKEPLSDISAKDKVVATQYYVKVTLGAPYPVKMYIKSASLDYEKAVFKLTDNKKEAKKYNKEALPSCRFDTSFEPVEDNE